MKGTMKGTWIVAALVLGLGISSASWAKDYTFEVPEKFVNITFESQMDVEDILGSTNKASGHLKWDCKEAASFKVAVPVASLNTGIALRDEHLRSEHWLDAGKHPEIVFEGSTVKKISDSKFQVTGTLTVHGVTKPLSLEVDLKKIPLEVAKKQGMGDSKWLRLRGSFQVKLSDHGVKIPDMAAAKVNDVWTVKFSVFAQEK
jgi:polyisoprenoid-binding protein YceI